MPLERTTCVIKQLSILRPLFAQHLRLCPQRKQWMRANSKLTSCPGRKLTSCPGKPKPPKNILAVMASKRDECIIPARREEYTCCDPLVNCRAPTCPLPCAGYPPPFDVTMYKPHDRRKAKYQRTWNECKLVKKTRAVCKVVKRKIPRRSRKQSDKLTGCVRAGGACSMQSGDAGPCGLDLMKKPQKCPKIIMPGCAAVRERLICKQPRDKDDCIRRQTRYPSYSECKRDPDRPPKNVECECGQLPPMCLVWREYRRRIKHNLRSIYCDPKKFE